MLGLYLNKQEMLNIHLGVKHPGGELANGQNVQLPKVYMLSFDSLAKRSIYSFRHAISYSWKYLLFSSKKPKGSHLGPLCMSRKKARMPAKLHIC